MNVFVDIETLPAPAEAEAVLQELYERKPGGSRSFSEYIRGTSLNGNWGRILCIGVAQDDQAVEVLTGAEPDILKRFWKMVQPASLFIDHNILDFDLPFIYKRSIINAIQPSRQLSFMRYRRAPIFDTMREWDNWSSTSTGLHQLALILGLISSKQDIDGSQVYDYYQAGKLQDIYDYCTADVELTRIVYKRLTFSA